jgi:membrane protein
MVKKLPRLLDTMPKSAKATERESAWKLGGLSIADLGKRVWTDIDQNEILDRSAALSYYFIFALFPTLLFLSALLALLPIPRLLERLMAYVGEVLPGDAGLLVQTTLGQVLQGADVGLLSVGAVTALWAASSGMTSIMTALNVESRSWWRQRVLAVGLTFVFSALAVVALLLLVFGQSLGEAIASRTGWGTAFRITWQVVRWPVAIVLGIAAISLVYRLAPAANQRWAWVTPGSAFAVVAWAIMSVGLRFYVGQFASYNATYGSIGGVILLMLWLYLSGVALLVGAEINSEIGRAQLGHDDARPGGRVAIRTSARSRPVGQPAEPAQRPISPASSPSPGRGAP